MNQAPPNNPSGPDLLVGRHRLAGDDLADARDVHQVLVVEVLRDRVAAPRAAAERRRRARSRWSAIRRRRWRAGLVDDQPADRQLEPGVADVRLVVRMQRGGVARALHQQVGLGLVARRRRRSCRAGWRSPGTASPWPVRRRSPAPLAGSRMSRATSGTSMSDHRADLARRPADDVLVQVTAREDHVAELLDLRRVVGEPDLAGRREGVRRSRRSAPRASARTARASR